MEEETPFLTASKISKLRAPASVAERTGLDEELEFKSLDDGGMAVDADDGALLATGSRPTDLKEIHEIDLVSNATRIPGECSQTDAHAPLFDTPPMPGYATPPPAPRHLSPDLTAEKPVKEKLEREAKKPRSSQLPCFGVGRGQPQQHLSAPPTLSTTVSQHGGERDSEAHQGT